MLAAAVLVVVIPAMLGMAWSAKTMVDLVYAGLASRMAFEFANIVFTGRLYTKSLNQ